MQSVKQTQPTVFKLFYEKNENFMETSYVVIAKGKNIMKICINT